MKKNFLEKELEELEFICEWCNFICDYFVELGDQDIYEKIEIPENYQKAYLFSYREAFRDINDTAQEMSQSEFTELNRRLKERFGKTLYDFQKNTDKKIVQILKRRKIRNEDEFRLAQMHIDRIFQDTEKEEEWKILEDLCFDFEQSVEVS